MFKSPLIAALGAVFALSTAVVAPAHAQDQQQNQQQDASDATRDGLRDRQVQPEIGGRTGRVQRPNRNSRPAEPTPEENIQAAQAIATSASVACQVSQANFLGQTAEGAKSYEAACATGPGYILISTTPPMAVDCVLLAGQAEVDRARDPAADVGTQCVIPQNTDVVRVISAYATEAGVPCAVDQAASIGKSGAGNLIYEVGCNGLDGYWIEKLPTGWKATECAIVTTESATCRFSTVAEQVATFKSRLVGSEAAACDVTEGRYMGSNANGAFWEAKCGEGNGVIVRFNPQYAVQQVYPCETAQRIGGGCRLTIVPDAPAVEPAPAAQQ
ncbi:hypothetical protein [Brevundimonas sp. NIBR11]|uniref:hypothetical protein n=1 Tax=Brevundimonas sp. NIBR11 TaxID=3015999 RepID=UPI0022F07831|nr:hypothetical protein [Brevundimonas sp. NIBR11]WGM30394.1 hypothetical protein KKHFBJBL_00617 [Brevundimonas sp. NIBR11]